MVDGALEGVRRRRAVSTEARPAQDLASPYRRSLRHPGGEGVPVVQPPPLSFHEPESDPTLGHLEKPVLEVVLDGFVGKSCLTAS